MKVLTILCLSIASAVLVLCVSSSPLTVSAQDEGRKPKEVYVLAPQSKLGVVTFKHSEHINKYKLDPAKSIECVQCHHTAQPESEAVKHPPHKTVWPADRTTTLTADLFEKNPDAPPVDGCTECHARTGEKPKLLAAIPTITLEGSAEPVVLNNQQAFHRRCGGCHDEFAKTVSTTVAPTSKKCVGCHKKTAA